MNRRMTCAALTGACLSSLLLSGCNLSIDNHDNSSASSGGSGGSTQGSSGTGAAQYSVGGSISGLAQGGLSLASGSNVVTVSAAATSFVLPDLFASGATYSISVETQPQGQTCVARNESGTVAQADVTNVQVTCTTNNYPIGGTITGLNSAGLVLANGSDTFPVPLGTSAYMMPTRQPMGSTYMVSVQSSPAGLSCQVIDGSGTMPAAPVSNVNIVCGQWAWIEGASATGSAGSYGSQSVASMSNAPAARSGAVSWTDRSGRLWLFGGATASGSLNDLWRYDPGTSEWTWMSGASSTGAAGQYGSEGMEAPGNVPGARQGATGWVDSSGNLWLFGGYGLDGQGSQSQLNDLWSFTPTP